jgi:predicted RND superfamily exporter protein
MRKKNSFLNKLEDAFGKWVIKHRWWIIISTLFLVVLSFNGMNYLTINNDTRVFFSEDNPQLQALDALENTYNKVNTVLFAIAPKDGDVFTHKTLSAIEELTDAAWQIPYSCRVNSISNFQHTQVDDDDLSVEDLVQEAEILSESRLQQIKKIALSEAELVNSLVSPKGHVTGVMVEVILPGKAMTEVAEIAAFARELKDDIRNKYSGIDIYLTGGVIGDNAFGEAAQKDMSTLMPLMFFVLVIITGIALCSFTGTFGTLIIIIISMITGMGIAGWLKIAITGASSNAPVIIMCLAVADSVHILVTIFQQMRLGISKQEAIKESLRINLQPVFLTSITTAIGFLSMNFSDAPPFRDLGNIVAIGVMAAFFYSVLFLPSLMAVLPVKVKSRTKQINSTSFFSLFANFVINKRTPVFWALLVAIVVLSSGILHINLNDNWFKYFDESYDFRIATDFVENNLSGYNIIEYSLESGESGGISNPDYLNTVDEFANWYRRQPKVVHVNTISNTMKRLNKDMHGGDESYYKIPEQRELAAQYLLLYEMSLPFGLDLNNRINVDKSSTRMIVTVRGTNTFELRAFDKKARTWLKTYAPQSMFTYGSGLSIIWAHISERNINSMLIAAFGALVLISVILMFALRSFKYGLLSLIPNLVPVFMAFGVWGFAVGQVGLGLSVIAAMTLGIVVDDTIHFMSKYLRAHREQKLNSIDAVRYSFNTVGTALWITTVALVAGFLVLSFSGYKMNSDMGLMTAITITLALVLDFMLLPTLLMKLDKKNYSVKNKIEEYNNEETNISIDNLPDAVPVVVNDRHIG